MFTITRVPNLSPGLQDDMDCDLALVNGQVVNSETGKVESADVAVTRGRIVGISRERGRYQGARTIDLTDAYVTPALVDGHVHCFQNIGVGGLHPDRIGVRQGVGAVVDAGSFGPHTVDGFREYVVRTASTRVFGLINISRWGKSSDPGEAEIIGFMQPGEVVRAIARNADWVRGVKVRAAANTVGALGVTPVRLAKQAAREAGVPLVVHVGAAPPTLEEICPILTSGDVITHCFHGKVGGLFTRESGLLPAVADALARGVVLDVGHGAKGFDWDTAEMGFALGVRPTSISSDLTRACVDGPVYSLATTLAKFLYLGMPLVDVIRAATLAPARLFGLDPEFGRIAEGGPANLSILAVVDRAVDLYDSGRVARRAERTIEARHTILDGVVFEADLT
ncbi:MAG TPA: amidohydrolase/deacetylase family metallohydrolase [Chloroflexota bacterium]|nr:amidohydrolase/deacetylase family metallohydrolase [Chloroflexota bacterium]